MNCITRMALWQDEIFSFKPELTTAVREKKTGGSRVQADLENHKDTAFCIPWPP